MLSNDNAMLVAINFKNWTAFKRDKSISDSAKSVFNMKSESGNFNKRLLPKFALKKLNDIITEFQWYAHDNTLAYMGVRATRILPTSFFMEFNKELNQARLRLSEALVEFKEDYVEYMGHAKNMLGDKFNESEYPTVEELGTKFSIDVQIMPIPVGETFNDIVDNNVVANLVASLEGVGDVSKQDLLNRTKNVLGTLRKVLDGSTKRIYASTISGNITKLVIQLTHLNLENDPLLVQLGSTIETELGNLNAEYIKNSMTYMKKKLEVVDNLLDLL